MQINASEYEKTDTRTTRPESPPGKVSHPPKQLMELPGEQFAIDNEAEPVYNNIS